MGEILLPSVLVSGGVWAKEGGGAGVVASIDEGIAGDDDTTYIDQADDNVFSPFIFRFAAPTGEPDFGSGIVSWAIRVRAKYVSVIPFAYTVQLRQGTELYTEFNPSLTTSYNTSLMFFNPAGLSDATDLRLWVMALPDAGGSVRVTAADLSIQTLAGGFSAGQNDRVRVQVF